MTTNNSINTPLKGQTGTGKYVNVNTPTFINVALGTPTSGTNELYWITIIYWYNWGITGCKFNCVG
jgi:hypothetical protein